MGSTDGGKRSLGPRTVLYPTPVMVVGTYDEAGNPNIMTVAWGGIVCSVPPCISVSVRQKARHTFAGLVQRKAFTVSIPSVDYVAEADFVGSVSGAKVDKFAATGLTPAPSDVVDAPYVAEFPLVLECRVLQAIDLGSHHMFIGEIMDVKADADVLDERGKVDGSSLRPISYGCEESVYYDLGAVVGKAFDVGRRFKGAEE
jgi:flavin reductase (DIM6/NTAB) family NADH-FMN oxidoreductase RutF